MADGSSGSGGGGGAAGATPSAAKQKTKLDFIVQELLGNEATYLADLTKVADAFVPAFERYATDPRVAFHQRVDDERVAAQLFGQFGGLRDLHQKLWEAYEENCVRAAGGSGGGGDGGGGSLGKAEAFALALEHVAPFFSLYGSYARSLGERGTGSLAVLQNCTAEVRGFGKKVEGLLAAAGLSTRMQVIENVMVKPCQHLMRYPMLLNEIEKDLEKTGRGDSSAARGVARALEAVRSIARDVDRAKGAIDSAELINMKKRSATLPRNFELVCTTRHIVDRFPCWALSAEGSGGGILSPGVSASGGGGGGGGDSSGKVGGGGGRGSSVRFARMEAQLTLCNDCAILDRRFAYGRAAMEILHVFRSLEELTVSTLEPGSPATALEAGISAGSFGAGSPDGGGSGAVLLFSDTAALQREDVHIEMSASNHNKLLQHLAKLHAQRSNSNGGASEDGEGGGGGSGGAGARHGVRKLPRLRISPNVSLAYGSSSQLLMPVEVAWFSLFCLAGVLAHAVAPDAVYHEPDLAWAVNRLVLKQGGYFVPLAAVQLFHFTQSRETFWADFVCTDLIGWLYVYTFTRFLFEPAVHVGSAALLSGWMSEAGVSSHLLMTYVSWGYALLVSDVRWFFPPDRPLSHPAARAEWGRYLACAAVLLGCAAMYSWMAYITSRFFHNAADWLVAALTATGILALLSHAVRNVRESHAATQALLLRIVAAETALVVALMVYDRWEGLGETGQLEQLIARSLGYAFWVNPLEGQAYYAEVLGAFAFGSFLRFCFLKRHGAAEWLLAAREAACALPVLLVVALLFVGNANVFRASVSVVAANVLAAQGRTLLTKHANALANVGQPDFEVGGGDAGGGCFALVVRMYADTFLPRDGTANRTEAVVVLRPVALFLVWVLFMLYNQVIASLVVQAAHAEVQLHDMRLLSFGGWLQLMAAASAGYHALCRWVEDNWERVGERVGFAAVSDGGSGIGGGGGGGGGGGM